jgi:glycosyltransferase involved in cell wall biosynthesis
LVENGVEGLIVNGRNIGQLADAMVKVATEHELNERMGKAAFARGGKGNSWGDYADRLLRFYGEALSNRSSVSTARASSR